MKRYISVTDPNYKRTDGSEYERKSIPKVYSKAPPRLFDREVMVVIDDKSKKKVKNDR